MIEELIRFEFNPAVGMDRNLRIPCHLPGVGIRIGKISMVATPGCSSCRLENLRPRLGGLRHNSVNFFFDTNVVSQGDSANPQLRSGQARIGKEFLPRKQCQD